MRPLFMVSVSCVALLLAFSAAPGEGSPPKGRKEDVKAKLRAVRKQLEQLRLTEKELLEELERIKKAEEKGHSVTIKVKGSLLKVDDLVANLRRLTPSYGGSTPKAWGISAKGITWQLDLQGKKEFLALAKEQVGNTVVVTGTLVLPDVPRFPGGFSTFPPILVVETLEAVGE